MHNSTISIVIAGDHPLVQDALADLFRDQPSFKVIDKVPNGQHLLLAVPRLQPDIVVITDILSPCRISLQTIEQLAKKHPETAVIAISVSTEPVFITKMIDAGARGYVALSSFAEEIPEAVTVVSQGDIFYCRKTRPLMERFAREIRLKGKENVIPDEKEDRILQLIAEEHTTKGIAAKTGHTDKTISSYSKRIKEKIGAKSVAGMVKAVYEKYMYLIKKDEKDK